jgi:hypothetical protein
VAVGKKALLCCCTACTKCFDVAFDVEVVAVVAVVLIITH